MELLRVGESLELLQASPEGRVTMRQPDLTSPHFYSFPQMVSRDQKCLEKLYLDIPPPDPPRPHSNMLR